MTPQRCGGGDEIGRTVRKGSQKRTLDRGRKQTKRGKAQDKNLRHKALSPGKRKSSSGKTYYERRPNRSDTKRDSPKRKGKPKKGKKRNWKF